MVSPSCSICARMDLAVPFHVTRHGPLANGTRKLTGWFLCTSSTERGRRGSVVKMRRWSSGIGTKSNTAIPLVHCSSARHLSFLLTYCSLTSVHAAVRWLLKRSTTILVGGFGGALVAAVAVHSGIERGKNANVPARSHTQGFMLLSYHPCTVSRSDGADTTQVDYCSNKRAISHGPISTTCVVFQAPTSMDAGTEIGRSVGGSQPKQRIQQAIDFTLVA